MLSRLGVLLASENRPLQFTDLQLKLVLPLGRHVMRSSAAVRKMNVKNRQKCLFYPHGRSTNVD